MQPHTHYSLTYQLVHAYNDSLDELIGKATKYLELYEELLLDQSSYWLNAMHPVFSAKTDILIGEIIPPFLDEPLILEFETVDQTQKELLEKITSALLDFENENTDYSQGRLVLQIKHIFKNIPDEGINYPTQAN
jgi:hypothetical protein